MKRYAYYLLSGCLVAGVIVWLSRSTPPAQTDAQRTDRQKPFDASAPVPVSTPTAVATTAPPPTKGRDYSERFVSMDRVGHDPEYANRVGKSVVINAYLASPNRGKDKFEPVLDWIVENGYDIKDLQTVWEQASSVTKNIQSRSQMTDALSNTAGWDKLTPEERQAQINYQYSHQEGRAKETMRMAVGLRPDEDKAMQTLWMFATDLPESLANWPMVLDDPKEGEPLLTDADWMDPHRQALAASYTGERHTTDVRKLDFQKLIRQQPPIPGAGPPVMVQTQQ